MLGDPFHLTRVCVMCPHPGPLRGGSARRRPGAHEFKQVESCFLNHNSSIHFCCTDSLLMTHRGGLCLSIIIWRIEWRREAKFPFALGPKNSLGGPVTTPYTLTSFNNK